MRKPLCWLCAVCALVLFGASVMRADVLDVVPERALLAIVVRNPDGLDANLSALGRKLSGREMPDIHFCDDVLGRMALGESTRGQLTTVDRKASAAVVMVVPAYDLGSPMGLAVKVTDYKKFLREVSKAMGGVEPEVTEDGTDVVPGDRQSLFVAPVGDYAVVARAEYVVKTFKAEKNRSLGVADAAEIRRILAGHDLVAYVNLDELVKTFKQQVRFGRAMLLRGIREGAPGEQGAAMARAYGAMFDMVINVAEQTDAVCGGVNFSVAGADAEVVIQPREGTAYARVAAGFRPVKGGLLDRFDVPDIAAAEWDLGPELLKELVTGLETVARKSGMMKDEGALAQLMTMYEKLLAAMDGPGALYWDAPAEGEKGGILRFTEVLAVKPGADVKNMMAEQMRGAAKLMDGFQLPFGMAFDYKTAIETHRNCPIDRLAVRFKQNDDPDADPNMVKMLQAMYGDELIEYLVVVDDKLVIVAGYPDTRETKKQIDRILDRRGGTLRQSAFWRDAVKGIPAGRSGVMVVSPARMMQTFMPPAMGGAAGAAGAEMAKAVRGVKFDRPSAAAMAFGPAKNGIAFHVNVPVQEMLNLKQLFGAMMDANPHVKRMTSMNNVRQIGLACNQYAGEHDGDYPANIETLLKGELLMTPKVLIAPGSGDAVRDDYPGDMKNATLAQLKLGPGNCSYVLAKGIRSSAAADAIVVYEKKPFYMNARCVFFNDGHVEFVAEERFLKLLAEQEKKLKEADAAP